MCCCIPEVEFPAVFSTNPSGGSCTSSAAAMMSALLTCSSLSVFTAPVRLESSARPLRSFPLQPRRQMNCGTPCLHSSMFTATASHPRLREWLQPGPGGGPLAAIFLFGRHLIGLLAPTTDGLGVLDFPRTTPFRGRLKRDQRARADFHLARAFTLFFQLVEESLADAVGLAKLRNTERQARRWRWRPTAANWVRDFGMLGSSGEGRRRPWRMR